jgi:hypothetical protein
MTSIMEVLTNSKLVNLIENFDIKSMTPGILKRLRFITEQREFNPESVRDTNVHISLICGWVLSVKNLYKA